MNSIKALVPGIAEILGLTAGQIYERQRALVRAGILKLRAGRGPGSGVPATPENVAWLLIAVLMGETRPADDFRSVAAARPLIPDPPPRFGTQTFFALLVSLLRDGLPRSGHQLARVQLYRDNLDAQIWWRSDAGHEMPPTLYPRRRPFTIGAMHVEATLDATAFQQLHVLLSEKSSTSKKGTKK